MELKQLKHDFQNNYLRLEVLLSIINDHLQSDQRIEMKYLEDFDQFLKLAGDHLHLIMEMQKKLN